MTDPSPKSNWKMIALILILVLTVLVLTTLLVTQLKPSLNTLFTSTLWSIAAGLATFIITFIVINRFLYSMNDKIFAKVENLHKKFAPHDDTTKEILNHVQGQKMNMVEYERKQLTGIGFYDAIFDSATVIKNAGVTMTHFIEALNQKNNKIIKRILSTRHMQVQILLLHPENSILDILNKQERKNNGLEPTPVTNKIRRTLVLLKELSQSYSNKYLPEGSSIQVRLTKEVINTTLTFACKKSNKMPDELLMGLFFRQKRGGPLYRVVNDGQLRLFEDCLESFEALFDKAEKNTVFCWNSKGTVYNPDYLSQLTANEINI